MKLINQPKGVGVCGQTCVAMIAGISLEESINLFKSKAGTRPKQVAKVLKGLGFKCDDKLNRITKDFELPESGIYMFKLMWDDKKGSHWVIWNGNEDRWYDPGQKSKCHRKMDWRNMYPTSYLEIKRVDGIDLVLQDRLEFRMNIQGG